MAPGVLFNESDVPFTGSDSGAGSIASNSGASSVSRTDKNVTTRTSALLNCSVRSPPIRTNFAQGSWRWVSDDKGIFKIFDASGGAAVSSIGYNDQRVNAAMLEQFSTGVCYAPSAQYTTDPVEEFAQLLLRSTEYRMKKVVFYNSGSEGTEAACKATIQYHTISKPKPEPTRHFFIARERSYHGATLGALEVSGHEARKQTYRPILSGNTSFISPCYPYRELRNGETEIQYVARLADELEKRILELGPTKVAGFFIEPVVGAALGCVAALPGYLAAMKAVCVKYGVLLIFDEVMCGMGRTGYLHAWQREGVVPDIQIVGKGLAGGYSELSAILLSSKISDALESGSSPFNHGHTFQNSPVGCAAALAVQKIIEDEHLLVNVKEKGRMLRRKLEKRLASNPHIGNIRGSGLFIGIELVSDKATKTPFPPERAVAVSLLEKGMTREYGIYVYPGSGCVNGVEGDHIIIAPAFNITEDDVDLIVRRVGRLIDDYFNGVHRFSDEFSADC